MISCQDACLLLELDTRERKTIRAREVSLNARCSSEICYVTVACIASSGLQQVILIVNASN
jgi:hypothetical protein